MAPQSVLMTGPKLSESFEDYFGPTSKWHPWSAFWKLPKMRFQDTRTPTTQDKMFFRTMNMLAYKILVKISHAVKPV